MRGVRPESMMKVALFPYLLMFWAAVGLGAAAMSTLDSSMHSISTAITTDFYQRFRPEVSDHRRLNAARWLVVIVGALATLVGVMLVGLDIKLLFFFFQRVLGFVSSGLVGVFILGVFTRRARPSGVLAGVAACFVVLTYAVWFTPLHFYLYAVIGISTAVVVGYAGSVLWPGQGKNLAGLTLHTQTRAGDDRDAVAPGSGGTP